MLFTKYTSSTKAKAKIRKQRKHNVPELPKEGPVRVQSGSSDKTCVTIVSNCSEPEGNIPDNVPSFIWVDYYYNGSQEPSHLIEANSEDDEKAVVDLEPLPLNDPLAGEWFVDQEATMHLVALLEEAQA